MSNTFKSLVFASVASMVAANTGFSQESVIHSSIEEKALASIRLEGYPDWIALDENSVWISNEGINALQRIDARSQRLLATIPINRPCAASTIGFGSVWTISCGDRTLVRINQKTNRVEATMPMSLASDEGSIVAAEDGVWVLSDKRGILTRVDPKVNRVIHEIRVKPNSFAVMAGFGSVWITNTGEEGGDEPGSVQRIDPRTNNVIATILVGRLPRFLAVGEGGVWTLNQSDGSVTRIDPMTNQVVATIACEVPGTGGDIAAGEGFVWVRAKNELLLKIDPASNRVIEKFGPPAGSGAVRAGYGAVWLTAHDIFTLWKLDVKRKKK